MPSRKDNLEHFFMIGNILEYYGDDRNLLKKLFRNTPRALKEVFKAIVNETPKILEVI